MCCLPGFVLTCPHVYTNLQGQLCLKAVHKGACSMQDGQGHVEWAVAGCLELCDWPAG